MADIEIFTAGSGMVGKVCSICQTAIVAGEPVLECPDCGLPFHQECWTENRGCSAYGCRSAPPTVKADGAPATTVWGGEKACPQCGGRIKAEALKCRFCGATFSTREILSQEEYGRREYEGSEFAAARVKVILFFLMSIVPCLSVVGAGILGWLIFKGRAAGLVYARLPGALRGLAVAGFVAGCLLAVLGIVIVIVDR
jgi:hypothetical protein